MMLWMTWSQWFWKFRWNGQSPRKTTKLTKANIKTNKKSEQFHSTKESNLCLKSSIKKALGSNNFIGNFQNFRKTNLPNLNKLFQKRGRKEIILNSFYEASITLREGREERKEGKKKRRKEETDALLPQWAKTWTITLQKRISKRPIWKNAQLIGQQEYIN